MKTTLEKLTLVCVSTIFISLTLTGQSFARIEMSDVVALWLFDEGDGEEVTDSSGNGHDGVIANPNWTDGKFDGGLELEGQGGIENFIVIPHHEDFNFAEDDFTIGFWVDSRKADAYIIVKRNGGQWWNMNAAIDRGGESVGFEYNAGGNDFLDGTIPTVNAGWHHCAAVREAGTLSLYVDGEFDVSEPVGNIDSETDITIGGWVPSAVESFVGVIDEVFIAKFALTPEELKTIMNGWEVAAVSPEEKLTTAWGEIKAKD